MVDVVRGKPAASRGAISYVWREIRTLPNMLTGSRLCAGIVIFLLTSHPRIVFGIVLWGAISDLVDGPLARWRRQVTDFGRVLDQYADFVFGASLVYTIYRWEGFTSYSAPVAVAIAAFSLAVWHLRMNGWALISSKLSKYRIFVQLTAGVVIIGTHVDFPIPHLEALRTLAYAALWFSLLMMVVTYIGYAKKPGA